ncbi:hypothetical protein BDP55DRAFT_672062 [Colletotrichum godetiae]|uniref:Uncharacterized protein n=1 Tax=Colletotrichum godetiae TaxID=1209918 RepID=A0AAJ0AFF3_9PEZI|nr:uncharacterized protein BDP55DRAFT_672062 [Colletotrichum godetiae]KAK1672885.1 hypothetical protein BDP55DRAFT_672062 [Colletotrichum godetiae]
MRKGMESPPPPRAPLQTVRKLGLLSASRNLGKPGYWALLYLRRPFLHVLMSL